MKTARNMGLTRAGGGATPINARELMDAARRIYREMLVTTPGLAGCISGAILFDETIRQRQRDGTPSLERCAKVTEDFLRLVFIHLHTQRVMLEGMILKPNMVLPGLTYPKQGGVDDVADATARCLLRAVPAAVPGIVFLSGGQPGELASARLNATNVRSKARVTWALSFSFARAIQQPALEIWRDNEANVLEAQQALYHRAQCNQAARRGEYTAAMEEA